MQCSITGCDRRAVGRGWCDLHWSRWRATGDPLGLKPRPPYSEATKDRIRAGMTRAWADGKFARTHPPDCGHCLATRGTPKPPRTQAMKDAVSAQRRAKREPSYHSLHHSRLPRDRGKASGYSCVVCGEPASDWALRADTPAEFLRRNDRGQRFSTRTSDYDPMCSRCHHRHDYALRVA